MIFVGAQFLRVYNFYSFWSWIEGDVGWPFRRRLGLSKQKIWLMPFSVISKPKRYNTVPSRDLPWLKVIAFNRGAFYLAGLTLKCKFLYFPSSNQSNKKYINNPSFYFENLWLTTLLTFSLVVPYRKDFLLFLTKFRKSFINATSLVLCKEVLLKAMWSMPMQTLRRGAIP